MVHPFLPIALIFSAAASAAPENLLRNGSFEGGLLYWHNLDPAQHSLVRQGAAVGEYALRLAKGNVMSAPFVAQRDHPMTVSFFVRGEKPGRVGVQMPPSAREVGTKAKRLWMRESEQSAAIGTNWQRVSFTWPADVPTDGFWPNPHYLVQIGGFDQPILIDGVTVTLGKEGTQKYVPRTVLEAVVECPSLPGYADHGNLLEAGKPVTMVAHIANASLDSGQPCHFQWVVQDYEGKLLWSSPDESIPIKLGRTVTKRTTLTLPASGTVLVGCVARPSMKPPIDWKWDASLIPLTTLPYPKAASHPDPRERFGGSFAGREAMLKKLQRIGFGWTRWFPETKWQFFQPQSGDRFEWHDEDFELAARHGLSQHVVLYGWPAWIMDKEGSGHPLPRDMRWAADDARWDDLNVETAWDRYVKAAAAHFKGKSIIFEIENEPEFDHWDKYQAEYVKFTIRTAKLIRATDPAAQIMINNVYAVPSPLNAALFKAGGLKYLDVVSWHDYHAGWLTDAQGISRMRQAMAEAGGNDVQLWFNEGWAYTNTAVDEPLACTDLTAAQSTNAQAASVAEMTVAGQTKTILFHTGYEDHGQSFWDYSGPGTLLWDWYNYPLPLVAMWNVLSHHIGLSEAVGFIRPPGANFTIFQDLRNGRGVMIAYADRGSKQDVTVNLPDFGTSVTAEDIMGNAGAAPKPLILSKSGRPVLLYTAAKTPGAALLEKLAPLDRKYAGFVATTPGVGLTFRLPPVWEGTAKGDSAGSIARADGKPVWKLEQVWPDDFQQRANYQPMVWTGTDWNVREGGFGGQPGATLKDGTLNFGTRAPHGPDQDRHRRTAGLTFVAQQTGTYVLHGAAACRMWDSNNKTTLHLLKKTTTTVEPLTRIEIPNDRKADLEGQTVRLAAGEELTLLPIIDGMFAGGDCKLLDFSITLKQ